MFGMAKVTCIQCRVDPQTKSAFRAFAASQGLNESALLTRWIDNALRVAGSRERSIGDSIEPVGPSSRVYVRLRPEDLQLLRARVAARGMPAATYVSMLVRVHLRGLPPLPDKEYGALQGAVAALSMVGRNLNQIARVANQTQRIEDFSNADLQGLLRLVFGVKDRFKELMAANTASWENGHDRTHR